MRQISRILAIAGGVLLTSGAAQAQSFTGSGCGGDTFQFCTSWTGTLTDATHFQLLINNSSGAAPANNPASAFTQVAIGNVTVADPLSMASVTGWQYDANVNGFAGFGLLENQFGSITTNGINDALLAGQSRTFIFTLSGALTTGQFNAAFAGVQIAVHDQGVPLNSRCASSKAVFAGGTAGQNLYQGNCGTSTVPEPSSYALMASGLLGIFAFSRRRRGA